MKKTIGNYTPDAGKVLKQSERVICCTGEDGMIYVTNGYLAYKFTPREYAAIVQPAVCCEAGSWTMNNGQKTGEPPSTTPPRVSRPCTTPSIWRPWPPATPSAAPAATPPPSLTRTASRSP